MPMKLLRERNPGQIHRATESEGGIERNIYYNSRTGFPATHRTTFKYLAAFLPGLGSTVAAYRCPRCAGQATQKPGT